MTKGIRTAGFVALSMCAAGFASVWRPAPHASTTDAVLLGAIYATPAEEIETHVLERGETLTGVLSRSRITGLEQTDLLLALRRFVNPRRLVANTEVTVHRLTEDGSTRSVEVRVNADTTVRMEREPVAGWVSRVTVTPVTIDTIFIAGVVEEGRSVFQTIATDESVEITPQDRYAVADALADIYQFKLNFAHDIKPGDGYRILYEREVRPDGSARRQRILGAEVRSQGVAYSAYFFDPYKDGGAYYDAEGKSLRYTFSRYPMSPRLITSGFGRRFHPILGIYRQHAGTDFGAAHGTPVKATGDGTIASAGANGGYGNVVVVNHPSGYSTRFAHLSRFAAGVRPGKRVKQGEVIGYVGSTGLSTAPHLHYELRLNGRPLNLADRKLKLPGATPLPGEHRRAFLRTVGQRAAMMDAAAADRDTRLAGGQGKPEWREGT